MTITQNFSWPIIAILVVYLAAVLALYIVFLKNKEAIEEAGRRIDREVKRDLAKSIGRIKPEIIETEETYDGGEYISDWGKEGKQ